MRSQQCVFTPDSFSACSQLLPETILKMHRTQNICADGFLLLLKAFFKKKEKFESKNVIIFQHEKPMLSKRHFKVRRAELAGNYTLLKSPVFPDRWQTLI